jgi:hypothetical protein
MYTILNEGLIINAEIFGPIMAIQSLTLVVMMKMKINVSNKGIAGFFIGQRRRSKGHA